MNPGPSTLTSSTSLSIRFGTMPLSGNLSACFGNGPRVELTGANGSGSSTLMHAGRRNVKTS